MREPKRLLVIAPHADDEVLGCGGVIQHHNSLGDQVFVNIVSNRIIDHEIDAEYIEATKNSASAVAEILGIKKLFFSDLIDERLDSKLIDVIVPIENVVQEIEPHIVFVPNGDDTDQDHRAVAAACRVACRSVNTIFTYEVPGPTHYFEPNFYFDIEQYIDLKIQAMDLYDGEWRPYPHPRSPEGLRIHSQARGLESNLRFAEAYKLTRHIQLTGKNNVI